MTWRDAISEFRARKAADLAAGGTGLRGVDLYHARGGVVVGLYLGREGSAIEETLHHREILPCLPELAGAALHAVSTGLAGLRLARAAPLAFAALPHAEVVYVRHELRPGVTWTQFLEVATVGPSERHPVLWHCIAYGLGLDDALDRTELDGAL